MSETNGTNNYPIVETGRLKAMFYEPKRSYACFKPRRFQRKESLASRSSVDVVQEMWKPKSGITLRKAEHTGVGSSTN